jgi:cellulase/cellobiase CelA1
VSYAVTNQWPDGFQGEVVVTNTSSSTIDGWTLEWRFTAGQQVVDLWAGTHQQEGAQVSVDNLSWNNVIAANGGTVTVGFIGSRSGDNPPPVDFTLNGTTCSTG